MKYIKIVCIITILMFFTGCSKTILDELPEGYYFELNGQNVDVYSDTKLSDLVKTTNIDYDKNIKLDTSTLGEKETSIEFKVNKNTYIYHIKYNVSDLSKPRILSSGDRYITVNSDVWLCDYIMYGDEYDNEPVCRVEGDYNLNEIGDYNIKYIVSDESGNEEYFETVLHVVKEIKTNTKTTTTYFSNVYNKHKNDNTMIGIDVSNWQGDIDFKNVKNAGAEFAIIRLGVEPSKTKKPEIDTKYEEYIKNAKEVGLKVGVYFYSNALTTEEAKEHANWVIDTLNKEELDLGIAFDWENFSKWNSLKLSFHDINEIANTFISTIEAAGYKGMLYSSKFYLENIWNSKYPVWLAHYTNNTNYEGDYSIWQMCNDGKISGIDGDVDIDIMYIN